VEVVAEVGQSRDVFRINFHLNGVPVEAVEKAPWRVAVDSSNQSPGVWQGMKAIVYDQSGKNSEARIVLRRVESEVTE